MSWLDRQSFLGEESDEVFAGLTVGLVGLGGGGSHVVQQLAHLGVGNFVLIDADVITSTNLNRLVGGTKADVDAALSKVDIAERVILAVNPAAKVEKHMLVWQMAAEALKGCDVIIAGVDNVRAKDELDSFTKRFLIPYIDMGMDVYHIAEKHYLIAGQVVLTGPTEPCLRCLGIVTDEALRKEAAAYGDAGGKPQVVWPNGLLASVAIGLFVQLVTPWKKECVTAAFIQYDGNSNSLKESSRVERCRKHPCQHYKVSDAGDPLFDVRKIAEKSPTSSDNEVDPLVRKSSSKWWARLIQFLRKS